ncbi:uncharacterized protein LOC143293753 [Babylonia areolata]|uniref:uncharacterized protein LOC143293753 n=1 Tax=Babylonia areolata TaxID=304850 RepID=UPI003FD2884E
MQAATTRSSSYNIKPELPAPRYSTPSNNYFSGDGKSYLWGGCAYYVPSERSWIKYQDFRSLPPETRRDAKDLQSEDSWVKFMRNRDQPSGYYFPRVGIRPCNVPELKLNGYTRALPSMPGRELFLQPWPKSDAWTPPVRRGRGEYYGYYHERIENERERRHRELPITTRIDAGHVPTFAYNSRWGFDQP